MLMSECVTRLQGDLAAIARLGDPATAEAGERIAAALDGALRTRLLELLGDAAVELDAQVPSGAVELRLAAGEPQLVYAARPDADPPAAEVDEDGAAARITLRLPERLKTQAEEAAARSGASLNTWLVRAISGALTDRGERRGRSGRLQGWAES
jgi:hypothetical protein